MKIHHIGYAVKNIDKALKEFKNLGFDKVSNIFLDKERKVKICFIQNKNTKIELIEPVDADSSATRFLKNGPGPYHLCYQLNDRENFEDFLKKGYVIVQPPSSAVALDGKEIVFLYRNNIGLVELILN